jgi:transcription factor AP-1
MYAMETTMYDDNSSSLSEMNAKKRKINMTLDLQPAAKIMKQEKLNEMLATPDLGMFMLASPDLERFIIQQNGLVLTTPTPTTQILFPKTVTEEQEAYARGFVDALSELHKNYGPPAVSATIAPTNVPTMASGMIAMAATTTSNMTTVTSLPGSIVTLNQAPPKRATGLPAAVVKMEQVQTVPVSTTKASAVPMSTILPSDMQPIDMDSQEIVKLERKRARNRLAATRCRNRKLERISRLEERVSELKAQNAQLMQNASMLRDEVFRLKRGIMEHTQRGCQVMLTHNLM